MHNFPFELVVAVDGEPRASSEVIANGIGQGHKSVIQLVRKHLKSLNEMGNLVAFQMRPRRAGQHGGGDAEYALLNEHQAALLISFMRNSDKVIQFKIALIKEFFRMRGELHSRNNDLWQQMQALIAKEVESKVRASFGSHLMLQRKKEIPYFRDEHYELQTKIQPSLLLN